MQSHTKLALLISIVVLAGSVSGDQISAPTSVKAVEGKKKFDQAIQALQKVGDDAAAAAKKQYVADLNRLLRSAMASATIGNANWAKAELARAEKGEYAPIEVSKVKLLAETREHFDRALDKAYVDLRPQVEAARRQYLSELEVCKKQSLSQAKDLEEANRIASEIQHVSQVDITSKEWVDLLASSHAIDWDQEKGPVNKKRVPQQDGSILLNGFCLYGRDFANGRIHARVRKISGQNLALMLRTSTSGWYGAYCNGGTSFGIGMFKDGRWTDFAGGVSKPYDGLAEMEFVASGQDLILLVGGQELIHVKDPSFTSGRAGILAMIQSQMADIRLKILDDAVAPPPAKVP